MTARRNPAGNGFVAVAFAKCNRDGVLPHTRPGSRNSEAIFLFKAMIAIAITPAAYEAIKASLPPRIDCAASPGPDGHVPI